MTNSPGGCSLEISGSFILIVFSFTEQSLLYLESVVPFYIVDMQVDSLSLYLLSFAQDLF